MSSRSNLGRTILFIVLIFLVNEIYTVYSKDLPMAYKLWHTVPLTFAVAIALVGTFINGKIGQIIYYFGVLWLLSEFIEWYTTSYSVLQDPDLGWETKNNKVGLVAATWNHVLALVLALLLLIDIFRQAISQAKEDLR